jgi:hypothetical protein
LGRYDVRDLAKPGRGTESQTDDEDDEHAANPRQRRV